MPQDLGFLHLDLLLLFNLPDLHGLGDDLLLHDVGLDLVGFVRLCLLLRNRLFKSGLLDFQVALGFGLVGRRQRFGHYAFLIRLRLGHSGCALRFGAFDGGVAFGFGGRDVRIALNARNVRATHVRNVLIFVPNLFDRE